MILHPTLPLVCSSILQIFSSPFNLSEKRFFHGRTCEALFPRKDINLIFVVWDSYSFFDTTYTESVTLFRLGEVIVRFVQNLFDAGADRKNMNFIGHSDGAATLALAAKQIHPRVGRLTGKLA